MKKCTKCGIEKSFTDFPKDKSRKDGHYSYCKSCNSRNAKSYYEGRKGEILIYQKEYRAKNEAYIKEYKAKRYLTKQYGISESEVTELIVQQNGQCEICKEDISAKRHIDHNHASGEIRGLLCSSCNRALGYFKDSPLIVKNAYQYLIEKGHYGQEAA